MRLAALLAAAWLLLLFGSASAEAVPSGVDKTPPVVTGGQPARAADVNGWYTRPVGISFSGSDQTSGISACTATTYGGPDSAAASVSGICQDRAGNLRPVRIRPEIRRDRSRPHRGHPRPGAERRRLVQSPRPLRHPGRGRHLIADCPSVTYGGPDSAAASFSAGCGDLAGNVASRSFALKYDTTPPLLSDLEATALNRGVALS